MRIARLLVVVAASLAAVASLAAPAALAAPPALTASEIGEAPLGDGVFRFPQAVAVTPGGGTVFVGDQSSGVVQAFAADGTFRFTVGFQAARGEAGRLGVVGGVATDRSGHLYVLDSQYDRVQVFDAADGRPLARFGDASQLDLLAGDPATIGGGRSASGIAVAQRPGGAPTVFIADQGNERVARYTLDPTTLQPTGAPAFSPPSVDLSAPQGIALDPAGTRVYVADDDHHRVVVLAADTLAQLGGVGTFGTGPGQLQNPYDVAVDAHDPNRLFVADNLNNRVDVFDAGTLGFLGTLGGYGYGPGTDHMAIVRGVGALTDVPGGGVDVADTANDRIQAFGADGTLSAIWGVSGRGPGLFTRPRGAAFAPDGSIAVADSFDERIGLFAPDGTWTGLRGQVSASTGFATAGGNPGQFDLPAAVAFDAAGNLWVADRGNDRVQELAADGRVLGSWPVGAPLGIAAAPGGGVYVAASRDGTVVRIASDGTTSVVRSGLSHPAAVTVGGVGGTTVLVADDTSVRDAVSGAAIAGPGGSATWDHPTGLALGADGMVYVSERRPGVADGARVVRRDVDGTTWDTIAAEGSARGQVVEPENLALSPDGRTLLVADMGNNRVQRFDAPGAGPAPRARLTVGVAGGVERGTVVSDLPGIACVSDCRQWFGSGRAVTLTAAPRAGSVVAGWTGACAGAGSATTCTVTMNGNQQAGVTFAAAPPPPAPAPPIATPAPAPRPRAAVTIRSVRLSTHTLHRARKANARRHVRARAATRAKLTIVLSRPARVGLRILAGRPGRRSGSSCVAITRRNRSRPACTRFLPTTRTRTLQPGRTTLSLVVTPSFAARRALATGRYRLSLLATDTDNNRIGPRTLSFRVTR